MKNLVYCYFSVRYQDKELAKSLGLRWEPEQKLWVKAVEYINHDDLFLLGLPFKFPIHHFSSYMVPDYKVYHLEQLARHHQKQLFFKSKFRNKNI